MEIEIAKCVGYERRRNNLVRKYLRNYSDGTNAEEMWKSIVKM